MIDEKILSFAKKVSGAPALAGGIIVAVILQIIFANSQFINNIFQTTPITIDPWIICRLASLLMIAIAASVNRFDPPN